MVDTYAYGYPRLGKDREYKKSIEQFWGGDINEAELHSTMDSINTKREIIYAKTVDCHPTNEITLYDKMLDTAILLGRYTPENLHEYYELCRGKHALKMTKWFNTNYHYLVPDFSEWNEPLFFKNKCNKNFGLNPYFIGPFTFLKLSSGISFEKKNLFAAALAQVYKEIIQEYPQVHLDEPAFVMDLSNEEITLIKEIYSILSNARSTKVNVFTYYDAVDWLDTFMQLPVQGIGLDFVNGSENFEILKTINPDFLKNKTIFAGVVDGTNVWKTNFSKINTEIDYLRKSFHKLFITNAGPLFHLPITLENEKELPDYLYNNISFANEKLKELHNFKNNPEVATNVHVGQINQEVLARVSALKPKDFIKPISVEERRVLHDKILNLSLLPTTTIGSFPQTKAIRLNRLRYKKGIISKSEYESNIHSYIQQVISEQEHLGLDVLVHGEPERSDMVEHFCHQLEGMSSTQEGWIISYGTRCYRPSIIHGDVSRPHALTIDEIQYAQSLTQKPVKGMLTGAVTIMAWDFVRKDIPQEEVAYQIALCLQDEIRDYEQVGIKIVQVDEPAFRELVPIKKKNREHYFNWAINSYNLTVNTDPNTQIHCHMCYSEFNEIIHQINQLDFDVLAIEATRSRGELIKAFETIDFKRQIGLGVWDIHSPNVPNIEDICLILKRALQLIDKKQFWINPDCGLKTRGWNEVRESIKNMVLAREALIGEYTVEVNES